MAGAMLKCHTHTHTLLCGMPATVIQYNRIQYSHAAAHTTYMYMICTYILHVYIHIHVRTHKQDKYTTHLYVYMDTDTLS